MGRDDAGARERKRHGRHYTPAALAGFLAARVAARMTASRAGLRVLDPACGSGELLFALHAALADRHPGMPVELVGYDLDAVGLAAARCRAARTGVAIDWREADFLAECGGVPAGSFDAVIANPPYVRTQQLGVAAQTLRGQFGLRGRFDLTHPFVAALPRLLMPCGVLGLLCANRFLTTKAGANLRAVLLADLTPVELYDLGDTKLFEAAVLPAVTVAVRGRRVEGCRYVSVYQDVGRERPIDRPVFSGGEGLVAGALASPDSRCIGGGDGDGEAPIPAPGGVDSGAFVERPVDGAGPSSADPDVFVRPGVGMSPGLTTNSGREAVIEGERGRATDTDLFTALCGEHDTTVRLGRRRFTVTVGELVTAAESAGWRMNRVGCDDWLRSVADRMWRTFGELGRIRVGIKTNADRIFIAAHWGEPDAEPELLCDLITHHDLQPWRVDRYRDTRVLYPYQLDRTRRVPVDLAQYPRTAAYLEQHREVLSARQYLTAAGREWFEHWVPQRPHLWRVPKVVFPDISDRPRFALDRSNAVVNGDCYWISLSDLGDGAAAEELACLMMGVANSTLGLRFYDAVCGNRLYSGRRRWITQYVSRLPVPDPSDGVAAAIIGLVRELALRPEPGPGAQEELDELVYRAFALSPRAVRIVSGHHR